MGKPLLNDFTNIRVWEGEDVPAGHVRNEVFEFREVRPGEFLGKDFRRNLKRELQAGLDRLEVRLDFSRRGAGEFKPQLEAPPDGAIEELRVISRGDYNHMARQAVNL